MTYIYCSKPALTRERKEEGIGGGERLYEGEGEQEKEEGFGSVAYICGGR